MDQANVATADSPEDDAQVRRAEDLPLSPAASTIASKKKHVYAGREWTAEHPLNIRMSIPLFFGRYYITIVAGRERRTRARLSMDKRQHPLETTGNLVFIFLISLVATVGSATMGYMLLAHLLGWSGRLIL